MNINPRNVGAGVLIGILLGLVAIFSFNCSDSGSGSPFGPSGLPQPTLPSSVAQAPASTPAPPASTPGTTEDDEDEGDTPLENCGFTLNRSGIEDDGGHFYVPVSGPAVGDVIIYVWIERVNDGTKYGPFDPNTNFVVDPPGYGTFNYQLAVELDTNGDGRADSGCQDDRHHGDFEQTPPPPPPPPPPPSCNARLRLQTEVGETTVHAVLVSGDQVVASKTFQREVGQSYVGSICEGDFNTDLLALSEEDRCCFPVEVPKRECAEGTVEVQGQCVPYCELNPNDEQCRPDPPECEFGEPAWNSETHKWECLSDCEDENEPSYSINGPVVTHPDRCETSSWTYKVTGGSPDTRESRCEDFPFSPQGNYIPSVEIPGEGVVDACVFTSYPGSNDFERGIFNPKSRFRLVSTGETCRPSGIVADAKVTFYNEGGTARLFCDGVKKDEESIELTCGNSGFVLLHYEHPTAHSDSTCEVQVEQ